MISRVVALLEAYGGAVLARLRISQCVRGVFVLTDRQQIVEPALSDPTYARAALTRGSETESG